MPHTLANPFYKPINKVLKTIQGGFLLSTFYRGEDGRPQKLNTQLRPASGGANLKHRELILKQTVLKFTRKEKQCLNI